MTPIKRLLAVILLPAQFMPASVLALELPERGPIPFAAYDRDANGLISEEEFSATRAERISERTQQGYPMRNLGSAPVFAEIDTNGDGQISAQEFTVHQGIHRQTR